MTSNSSKKYIKKSFCLIVNKRESTQPDRTTLCLDWGSEANRVSNVYHLLKNIAFSFTCKIFRWIIVISNEKSYWSAKLFTANQSWTHKRFVEIHRAKLI